MYNLKSYVQVNSTNKRSIMVLINIKLVHNIHKFCTHLPEPWKEKSKCLSCFLLLVHHTGPANSHTHTKQLNQSVYKLYGHDKCIILLIYPDFNLKIRSIQLILFWPIYVPGNQNSYLSITKIWQWQELYYIWLLHIRKMAGKVCRQIQ